MYYFFEMGIIQKNKKDIAMYKIFIITISILYSTLIYSKSTYQIDLILFSHPQSATQALDLDLPLLPTSHHAIALKNSSDKSFKSYNLLPNSQSGLRNEYYLLQHKSNYKVLGHYSWIQPANNQSMVSLPNTNHTGWQVQGTVNVRQSTYYTFNADLQFSPPSNPQSAFTVSQKQRLKGNVVYYLDNPQIGMVVKIHPLA